MRRWVPTLALGLAVFACADTAGALGVTPVVAPGDSVSVDVGGFAGHTAVTVQLAGRRDGHQVLDSDGHGRIRTRYPAPLSAGSYRVIVSGRSATAAGTDVVPVASGVGDEQTVTVTVPLVLGLPFRVGGAGVGSAGDHTGDGAGLAGSGTAGLAETGTDLRTPLVVAAALGLLGVALSMVGRRRDRV